MCPYHMTLLSLHPHPVGCLQDCTVLSPNQKYHYFLYTIVITFSERYIRVFCHVHWILIHRDLGPGLHVYLKVWAAMSKSPDCRGIHIIECLNFYIIAPSAKKEVWPVEATQIRMFICYCYCSLVNTDCFPRGWRLSIGDYNEGALIISNR